MGRLGGHLLYTLLLLTEKPAAWRLWQIAPVSLVLAAVAGLAWSAASGRPPLGLATGLVLVAFAAADWAWLTSLPHRGLSYGPVQAPWLGLVLVRWLCAVATFPLAARWPIASLAGLGALQAALWFLLAHGTAVAPFRIEVTQLNLGYTKIANPGGPLRIVHLSDLHVERLTRRERALPDLVAGLAPDLIAITGDLLNATFQDDRRALSDLEGLLAQLHAPGGIYAVWGSVEVDQPAVLRPVLENVGVVILEDRSIEYTIRGHRLWIMGLSCSHDLDADGARLRALLDPAPGEALTVLLYHTPDLMPQAATFGVDLYLAGHTHGGQWRLPVVGALLTSSTYWKRYEAGHYHEGDTHLYVSRGLGMEGFGMPRARFLCPPEVVSISLSATNGQGDAAHV
jgi:predicted MPP superfamily phosphohydrolase